MCYVWFVRFLFLIGINVFEIDWPKVIYAYYYCLNDSEIAYLQRRQERFFRVLITWATKLSPNVFIWNFSKT